jgi:hypothetical protein
MTEYEITDNLRIIVFTSKFDKTKRELLLSMPSGYSALKEYPLIISPHFFGATFFENYYLGAAAMKEKFNGWRGISDSFDVLVAIPFGHGRIHDKASMAYEAQIDDMAYMPELLESAGFKIGKKYAGGISMGAIETLTCVGRYPELFSAAFSFNAITDLEAWYYDILDGKTDRLIIESGLLDLFLEEVGGTPEGKKEEFLKRSPVNYIENLSKVPLMIYWSAMDSLVVNAETKQSKKLADQIRNTYPASQIYDVDTALGRNVKVFDRDERIKIHEYCDFRAATEWLLQY